VTVHPLLGGGHQFAAQMTGLFLVKGGRKLALHPAVEFESLPAGFEAQALAVEVLDPGGLLAAVSQRDRDSDARQIVRVARRVSPERGVLHPGDGFRIGTDTRLLHATLGRSNQRARLDETGMVPLGEGQGLFQGECVDRRSGLRLGDGADQQEAQPDGKETFGCFHGDARKVEFKRWKRSR
jgi:hypothetical protein